MCSENCVTACEGREWNAPGCVQTLDLSVCVRVCVAGEAESQAWLPVTAGPPSPSHLPPPSPRPLLGSHPVCKHSLFLSVASLAARPEKGYNPGGIVCHPLPGPRTPPQAPAAAAEVLFGGESGWWKDAQGPFPSKFNPETWGHGLMFRAIAVGFLE